MIVKVARNDRRTWAMRSGVAIALALLAINLGHLVDIGVKAVTYPHGLDYGEGIVWQQMINILAGSGYSPIGVFPAIVYHYPPVYHLTVGAVAWTFGSDGLATGRTVSLLSTLASIGITAWLVYVATSPRHPRPVPLLAGLIAGGCAAASPVIIHWAALMRVDMVACMLSLAGLALVPGMMTRPKRIPLAALCFVLAVYSKQTSIAAPAAAFVALWLARPRAAWMLFAWCGGLGLTALAGLSLMSDGGFLRHTLLYNLNRLDLSRARIVAIIAISQIYEIAIALLGVMTNWQRLKPPSFPVLRVRLAASPADLALVVMLIFLVIRTAMLPTTMKSGASENYLIEWLFAIAMLVGTGAAPVIEAAVTGKGSPSALLVALVTIGLPIQAYGTLTTKLNRNPTSPYGPVVARISQSDRPVISDDMVLLIRGGQPVRWEPAIAAELGDAGLYDEAAFARMIRAQRFGFFVTYGDRGSRFYNERYNPVVADAMDAAYPWRERYGNLVLHMPRRVRTH